MWLTHFSPLIVERSQNNGLMTKILCLTIIHFNIWKMIGQGRSLFEHSLHLKRESSWVHVSNSEKNMKTKTKGAHLWALCGGWAIRPFQHRGSAPFVTRPAVGTYGTWGCFAPPSPPPGIINIWQACYMRPCVLIEKDWWKLMKKNVKWHYNWKYFLRSIPL